MRTTRYFGLAFSLLLLTAQIAPTVSAALPGHTPGSWYASTDGNPTRANATDPINIVVYGDWNGWDTVEQAFRRAGWGNYWCCTANPLYAMPVNHSLIQKVALGVGDFDCTTDNCRDHLRIWSDFDNGRYCASLGCPGFLTKSPAAFPTLIAVSHEKCVEKSNTPPYGWLGCKRHEVTDFDNARTQGSNAFTQGIGKVGRYRVNTMYTPAYSAGKITTRDANNRPHDVSYNGMVTVFTVN